MEGESVDLHNEEPLQQEVHPANAVNPHLRLGCYPGFPEQHPGHGFQEGVRAPFDLGQNVPCLAGPVAVQVAQQKGRLDVPAVVGALHHNEGLKLGQAQERMKEDIGKCRKSAVMRLLCQGEPVPHTADGVSSVTLPVVWPGGRLELPKPVMWGGRCACQEAPGAPRGQEVRVSAGNGQQPSLQPNHPPASDRPPDARIRRTRGDHITAQQHPSG